MKFRDFKRFSGSSLGDLVSWVQNELNSIMRELFIGLNNLKFRDNFQSYEIVLTLTAGEERQIAHPLKVIPSGYLILKQQGDAVIDAGITSWTNEVVYLRNNSGTNSATIRAIFFA